MEETTILYIFLAIWLGVGAYVLAMLARNKQIDDFSDCILVLVLGFPIGAYTLIKDLIDKFRRKPKP